MNEQSKRNDGTGGRRTPRTIWVRIVGWGSTISDFLHYVASRLRNRWGTWWQEVGRQSLIRGTVRLAFLVLLGFMASAVVNYTYRAYSLRQYRDLGIEYRLGAEMEPEIKMASDDLGEPTGLDTASSGRVELGPKAEGLAAKSEDYTPPESGVEVVATTADRFRSATPGASGMGSDGRVAVNPAQMTWPVQGQVLVGYGWVRHPVYRDWRFHPGVEFSTPLHASVQAVMEGRVLKVQSERIQGLVVTIAHGDDWQSVYRGLAQLQVQEGQLVKQGQSLGLVGSSDQGQTGRLIFEIRQGGTPLDPRMYLP
ncbi:MAG: M23 family metallopeptidase [Firmicutes bacterium]|nr:M23 family metallopeptidase [Bacillota bacterium]